MNTMSTRRRIAALLVLACFGAALPATSPLAGKWTGSYGGAVSGHFTIHWRQTGSRLHGSITLSNPSGTYGIGGSVRSGKIKFGAVSVGATYKGKVRGTSMSGTWTSPQGGGSWSASKASGRAARRIGASGLAAASCPAPPLTEPGAAGLYASSAVPAHADRLGTRAHRYAAYRREVCAVGASQGGHPSAREGHDEARRRPAAAVRSLTPDVQG